MFTRLASASSDLSGDCETNGLRVVLLSKELSKMSDAQCRDAYDDKMQFLVFFVTVPSDCPVATEVSKMCDAHPRDSDDGKMR